MATLREMVAELNGRRGEAGEPPMDVVFSPFEHHLLRSGDVSDFCAALAPRRQEYAEAGVTWFTIEPASRDFEAFERDVAMLGERLIDR
jgi:hypothetical protein